MINDNLPVFKDLATIIGTKLGNAIVALIDRVFPPD